MDNSGDKTELGEESNTTGVDLEEPPVTDTDDAVSTEEASSSQGRKKTRPEKPIRTFPQYSIKEAMKVAQIIGKNNAGNPWAPEHVASALGTSKQTNSFFYLSSASRDYGFTTGTSREKLLS